MNQCDGCKAGIPVIRGMHRMGEPGKYPDYMTCERDKYLEQDDPDVKLIALLNRHDAIARAIEACRRENLVGHIGAFYATLGTLEEEIGIYERRLGLRD